MDIAHIRHTLAHLLAAAVKDLYPDVKPTIGPAVENGFYYDFEFSSPISEDDLPHIEQKMRELLPSWTEFSSKEVTVDEAKRLYKDNTYKKELVDEIAGRGETPTLYTSGGFTDLCRGGHAAHPANDIDPDAFALTHLAGAYWRGDEKNPMLTRIYGLAFESKKELDEYRAILEEAKKRDHRKLAVELDLFSQHDVSPGAIFWHPKGMVLWRELERFIREKNDAHGYGEVSTPVMVKKELFETSGHWQHYRENGFWFEADTETYVLKPMNCPESTLIYAHALRSYRDLPIRLAEPTGRLHRNELRGTLGGLFRLRQFTQDDAHVFCRPDQIEHEITTLIRYTKEVYDTLGFPVSFKLATKPDDAMGEATLWEKAEAALENVLKKAKIDYELKPKDGAFYGPKIDIHAKDALGRGHQLATIQLDFQMPERFELSYVDKDGSRARPVMIHRAIFGSFERFMGVLIEHFAGAFPVWLSPVQAVVLPVSDNSSEYAKEVLEKIRGSEIRVEMSKDDTLGKRIREAELQKIPYILVVGEKEAKAGTVNVRSHKDKSEKIMPIDEFIKLVRAEIDSRIL